jgi:hypothetical protein
LVLARLLFFKELLSWFGEVGRLEIVRRVIRSPSHLPRRTYSGDLKLLQPLRTVGRIEPALILKQKADPFQ